MEFGVCGINYKHAGLDIRDKTAFTDSRKITLSEEMEKKGIGGYTADFPETGTKNR